MKIAYVLTAIDHLGPFIVAKDTIDLLINEVEKIDIFYFKEAQNPLEFKVTPQKISFYSSFDFSGYDVVHSHGFMADVFAARNVKKKARWVSTLHQKIFPNYSFSHNKVIAYFLEHFWLACLRRANVVATLTKDMRDYYIPKLKGVPVKHVYNGIPEHYESHPLPIDELAAIHLLKKKTTLLVMSARLVYLKGIDRVIEVLAMSQAYSLLLVGEGEEKEKLQEQASKLNVDDRVLFVGYKSNPQDYLRLADIYVMASRTEGFGLCVIEAASQKLPVVCNDLPVFREIFDDEVVRFDLDDQQSILSALNTITAEKNLYSEKIYHKFLKCYTSQEMKKNYILLYHN